MQIVATMSSFYLGRVLTFVYGSVTVYCSSFQHGGIPQWQYITSQVRRHQDDTSLQQLLQTYLTYIESSRLHRVSAWQHNGAW